MKASRLLIAFLVACFLGNSLAKAGGGGGLYDDEKKITSGDIKDLDYWHAKYYHLMLEEAIKSRQPEYLVGHLADSLISGTWPSLVKKYPKDEELKAWQARSEEISKKISPNADRLVHWKPDFAYWDSEHYRQAWVNMRLGKMAQDDKDWPDAASRYGWAATNLQHLIDHEDDFMKSWPEEIIKWVKDTKVEADKVTAEMKKK